MIVFKSSFWRKQQFSLRRICTQDDLLIRAHIYFPYRCALISGKKLINVYLPFTWITSIGNLTLVWKDTFIHRHLNLKLRARLGQWKFATHSRVRCGALRCRVEWGCLSDVAFQHFLFIGTRQQVSLANLSYLAREDQHAKVILQF